VTPDTIDPNQRWLTVKVPHSTRLGKITILRPGRLGKREPAAATDVCRKSVPAFHCF
jgi:hypothetical protein